MELRCSQCSGASKHVKLARGKIIISSPKVIAKTIHHIKFFSFDGSKESPKEINELLDERASLLDLATNNYQRQSLALKKIQLPIENESNLEVDEEFTTPKGYEEGKTSQRIEKEEQGTFQRQINDLKEDAKTPIEIKSDSMKPQIVIEDINDISSEKEDIYQANEMDNTGFTEQAKEVISEIQEPKKGMKNYTCKMDNKMNLLKEKNKALNEENNRLREEYESKIRNLENQLIDKKLKLKQALNALSKLTEKY